MVDPGSHWLRPCRLSKPSKPICAILLGPLRTIWTSLDLVREFGNPPVYIAESEASWLYTPVDNLSGLPRHDDMADVIANLQNTPLAFMRNTNWREFRFTVLPTPGHSIGGVSIVSSWCSPSLDRGCSFPRTIGRTDLPTGSMEQPPS